MKRKLILALFSAAILFAMVREWRAPTACPFPAVIQSTTARNVIQSN